MPRPFVILADAEDYVSIIFTSMLLAVVTAGLFYAVIRLKKWLKEETGSAATGLSLSDLRALHKSGKMSDEEFEKAKSLVMISMKASVKSKSP